MTKHPASHLSSKLLTLCPSPEPLVVVHCSWGQESYSNKALQNGLTKKHGSTNRNKTKKIILKNNPRKYPGSVEWSGGVENEDTVQENDVEATSDTGYDGVRQTITIVDTGHTTEVST